MLCQERSNTHRTEILYLINNGSAHLFISTTFLVCSIFVDRVRQVYRFSPFLKPGALKTALSLHSGHPVAIHGAWLRAYMLRLRKRSSCLEWFNTFKSAVLERLISAGIDRAVVSMLDKQCTFTYPVPSSAERSARQAEARSWLVLPYHPVWRSRLSKGLAEVSRAFAESELPGVAMPICVSWSLHSPSLATAIMKY